MIKKKTEKLKSVWFYSVREAFGFAGNLSIPRETPAGFLFLGLGMILTAAVLFSALPQLVFANENSAIMVSSEVSDRPFGERKMLRGHIGGKSKEGLALELNPSQEMWFPYSAGMRLSGYLKEEDIQSGDEVIVTYEENTEKTKRVLREVNFVQRKAPAPEVPESDEPEADL